MLVNITVENFKSFDKKEELSMISSSKFIEECSNIWCECFRKIKLG
ncbi:hypothetical protein [Lachnoanaerobaculum umeaense]|nr:hypothetical protein [Lachnoanaerobaculum umeaense]